MALKKKKQTPTYEATITETYHGHELETEVLVEYEVEPGERPIRYGDNACAGSDATVEILAVRVVATGESIELTEGEANGIKDTILDDIEYEAAGRKADADDRAYEDAKDRRLFGDDR